MLLQSSNLLSAKRDKLRRLLESDGLPILFEVLESMAFEREAEAANALLEERTGYDAQARAAIQTANNIHASIVLIKLLQSKTEFTICTAKPNTKNNTKTK
jgi:hypothetical protein